MNWSFEDRPTWDTGKFRITISQEECRVKCNVVSISDSTLLAVVNTTIKAIAMKKQQGITCTVRSTDTEMNFSNIKFYAKVQGKKEKLIEVEREDI